MAKIVTVFKATYDLSEFDMRNIALLEAHTGLDKLAVVHQALTFCQLSLQYRQQGKCTSVLYKRSGGVGTTYPIDHADVAKAYNNREPGANKVRFMVYRQTEALQALGDIKKAIKTKSDDVALAYALEYAATCVRRLQSANNGRNARIFFSKTNDPSDGGQILNRNPYDVNLANKFRKAKRGAAASLSKLVPFRKEPKILHSVEYLPADEARAVDNTPAEKSSPAEDKAAEEAAAAAAAQKAVDKEVSRIQDGLSEPVVANKPLTLKKREGFSL